MYNTYRSSTKDNLRRSHQFPLGSVSSNLINKDKLINIQKREKLKGLLITKFMKKYGIKSPESVLEDEINKFLMGEKLTDGDLKNLDEKLKKIILDVKQEENIKKGLVSGENPLSLVNNNTDLNMNMLTKELLSPNIHSNNSININDAMSIHSIQSKMSGASHLSKYSESHKEKMSNKSNYELDDLELLSGKNFRSVERFDFPQEGDEWNAIVKYNHKLFEDEKKNNKMKDLEIKRRTREDLDNQIRQKLKRNNDEFQKNLEYDAIILNHCDYLQDLDQKRQQEARERVMKEKENRDKQLQDEQNRKKIELFKEKKYDKEYVKNIQSELEKDKQIQLKRRLEERELMFKTIKENELNKIRALENKEKERISDIKATEEYARVLDRQEQERAEYFRKIERNGNNFINKMAENVLHELENKTKEEEEKMRVYLIEKERREKEEDERKKRNVKGSRKMMKNFYDMQVQEKKRMNNFEKTVDAEQARIWQIDTQKFFEQEKEISDKIKSLNIMNCEYLKNQIESKKASKHSKMNEHEYALNHKLLQMIKHSPDLKEEVNKENI